MMNHTAQRNVCLVVGPPGGGKSTHADALGPPVMCREQYRLDRLYKRAVVARASLPEAQLTIVRCCPSLTDVDEWRAMCDPTTITVVAPDLDECVARILRRGRPGAGEEVEAARLWWRNWDGHIKPSTEAQRLDWTPTSRLPTADWYG